MRYNSAAPLLSPRQCDTLEMIDKMFRCERDFWISRHRFIDDLTAIATPLYKVYPVTLKSLLRRGELVITPFTGLRPYGKIKNVFLTRHLCDLLCAYAGEKVPYHYTDLEQLLGDLAYGFTTEADILAGKHTHTVNVTLKDGFRNKRAI